MKKCFKCKLEKPVDDFYAHPHMADGYLGKCKECTKGDVRKHRAENDSVREYDKRRYYNDPKRREQNQQNAKRWRQENPEGYKAQCLTHSAVRSGRLKRKSCEKCGNDKTHAHHEDYSKPLDVIWLCARCHHRHHAGYK